MIIIQASYLCDARSWKIMFTGSRSLCGSDTQSNKLVCSPRPYHNLIFLLAPSPIILSSLRHLFLSPLFPHPPSPISLFPSHRGGSLKAIIKRDSLRLWMTVGMLGGCPPTRPPSPTLINREMTYSIHYVPLRDLLAVQLAGQNLSTRGSLSLLCIVTALALPRLERVWVAKSVWTTYRSGGRG